jgi:predicted metal-dependent phosphotriesterase family hydrolase
MVPEGHVVTVLGPRAAGRLGVVDAHEHLLLE